MGTCHRGSRFESGWIRLALTGHTPMPRPGFQQLKRGRLTNRRDADLAIPAQQQESQEICVAGGRAGLSGMKRRPAQYADLAQLFCLFHAFSLLSGVPIGCFVAAHAPVTKRCRMAHIMELTGHYETRLN